MASQAATKGRPLPKFGEWDVNNPASAEGFTVVFNKAREQKKTNGTAVGGGVPAQKTDITNKSVPQKDESRQSSMPRRWLCCYYGA
ncbi:hypothetical protein Ancab_026981 [Ancistrocladus abbreviatus]